MSNNLSVPPASSGPLSVSSSVNVPLRSNPDVPLRPNLYALLIQNALSKATQRTYAANLKRFFRDEYDAEPETETVLRFLSQDAQDMAMQLAVYRNRMTEGGSAAASVKVRLASINALVDLGHKFRLCGHSSKGLVQSPPARSYRDTRGPGLDNVRRLLALPDRTTLRGKRDYAMLRLLTDNALRRAEVCALQVADFEPGASRIAVLGKGYADKIWITLDSTTASVIGEYLERAGHTDGALFRNCAFRASAKGAALTDDGLDDIVRKYGAKIGLKLSPHKFRHFAITAALDQAGGDVRKVQKFSRHKKLDTVITYDDNRSDIQGEITALLGKLLDE